MWLVSEARQPNPIYQSGDTASGYRRDHDIGMKSCIKDVDYRVTGTEMCWNDSETPKRFRKSAQQA